MPHNFTFNIHQIDNISLIPNLGKNVTLKLNKDILEMRYTLSCPKDFPHKSFISKSKKAYLVNKGIIDLSLVANSDKLREYIYILYYHLKNTSMIKLREWKISKLYSEIQNLH